MRLRIAFLALAAAIPAMPQPTPPAPPLLDTGLPNLFPTPPPLVTGARRNSGQLTILFPTNSQQASATLTTAPPTPTEIPRARSSR